MSNILACNVEYLRLYSISFDVSGLKQITKKSRMQAITIFIDAFASRDVLTLTKEELESYSLAINRNQRIIKSIKRFYRVMGKADLVRSLRYDRKARSLLPGELLEQNDIDKMLNVSNTRDKAIISLLWDTGIRPIELLTMTKSSVQINTQPMKISVDGKTGQRIIPIQDITAKYLLDYLGGSCSSISDYLWATKIYHHNDSHQLKSGGLDEILKHRAYDAGVTKKIYSYIFRHSAATRDAASGWSEIELCLKYGWVFGSSMPRIYIHATTGVLDKYYTQTTKVTASFSLLSEQLIALADELRKCKR